MENKRNRSRLQQLFSLEMVISVSEAETSQGTRYRNSVTLGSFEIVSSVRSREAVSNDGTENEMEMQVWSQRKTDKTNRKKSELRKERFLSRAKSFEDR